MLIFWAVERGLVTALAFFWDSFFGLILGFLISAVVQVVLTPRDMHRYLGPNLRGILNGSIFGIISSACSYGAAAAARGFYQRGADARSVFAFLISSTNMNLAILILFWAMLGWKFAFAEFFGGVIIIAVVTGGLSVIFGSGALGRMERVPGSGTAGTLVTECPLCSMEGEADLGVTFNGTTYLACGRKHYADLSAHPERCAGPDEERPPLWRVATWQRIVDTALGDIDMLWKELLVGYLIAGFAAALIPPQFFGSVLSAVGSVPFVGYALLLSVGLVLAVITFLCSMGNVPVARFLAGAGIPLGANTSFIYGDLLIPPLIAIYRKSFPPRLTWAFVGLFVLGALLAGAIMDITIGHALGGMAMGSMALSDRITMICNAIAIAIVLVLAVIRVRPQHAAGAAQR